MNRTHVLFGEGECPAVMDYQNMFFQQVMSKDMAGSMRVIDAALADKSLSPHAILLTVVSSAMDQVGKLQLNQIITLSEVFMMAAIGNAAIVRPPNERNEFLIRAGRQVTALLSHDIKTMEHILHLIKAQML